MLVAGKFDRLNVLQVYNEISIVIKGRKPFSLLRLGDGEGRLLGYPESVSRKDLNHSLDIWFGDVYFNPEALVYIKSLLINAIRRADIVGIPREKQIKKSKAYARVIDFLDKESDIERSSYTDAAIHRYLQFGLFYKGLLSKLDFLGTINGHDISREIQEVFSISKVTHYAVPTEAKYADKMLERHYPERFEELKRELIVPYTGAVFLVGAGILGKVYCQWIKDAGGIALDIGAMFDGWARKGRLQHECHSLEVYAQPVDLSLGKAIQRYHDLCHFFEMDSEKVYI